jgi:hypothetical protein
MVVGMNVGYDVGRVRLDGVESDTLHRSQTIGLWMDILATFIVHSYFSFNEGQNTLNLKVGFIF